jgi:hypothetical protein
MGYIQEYGMSAVIWTRVSDTASYQAWLQGFMFVNIYESSIVYVINQSCKNYMGARLYHVDIKWRVILCLIQVNSKKN